MALIQWWVGAAVLGVGAAVGLLAWLRPPRAPGDPGVLVAAAGRLRRLPSWEATLRRESRRRVLAVAGAAVALAGLALLGSRLVAVSDDSEVMRQRDVVLCMDVSGSMVPVVEDIVDTYRALVDELTEERIGFVMFDANAVTGFALTDDHEEVAARLAAAREELGGEEPVAGTTAPASGSSLVGDGLASCVQHFDRPQEERARTLVLATDNLVSGDSIYTLQEATDLAVERDVMVFGITPRGTQANAVAELRGQIGRTHGDVLLLTAGEATNAAVISMAVAKQERAALLATAQEHSFDVPAPGVLITLLGLGMLAAAERRRP
ncbi:VWA domain-containing protein [Nocardioides marmotae]|uniref:VWA domain-containing protein n=1 Tax=Nocardioides marmotae TaxID=2663857 RepID=A0A6I3JAG5_9ACTN|nr:vWA domain-containing protein [Nocardioides marmotae]MCR6030711.1 VWA domain-containing protein [Gordonia jinghuaiqii]MBC9734021.1 VWA domain-containing protein [Nocardioides marmotae]MTB85124.1 VWA domain-containing protein [Nocardioides marmotae]MTB94345.1 VWA domain-containing protein [Nocardioides marmotae]QKE01627.1 VWA domain-containing protein [Nocardioides marmotae]